MSARPHDKLVGIGRRRWLQASLGLTTGLGGSLLGWPVRAQAAGVAPGDLESPISAAEQWLFLSSQLTKLALPARLVYRFESTGSLQAAEAFDLTLKLSRPAGRNELQATVVIPNNEVPIPMEEGDPANPIVPWFLDRDVATMERLTGGQRRYFQKRVRYALAQVQQVPAVQVARPGGSPLAAQQVTVQPYLRDPLRNKFEKLTGKRYRFTLAASIPGQVWQVQTVIPGADDKAEPLLTQTMTFVGLG